MVHSRTLGLSCHVTGHILVIDRILSGTVCRRRLELPVYGLLSAHPQLILPSEILTNFEVVRVEEEASLIRIYLDESVKVEYKENPEIESKGFCEAVTIRDFPIRDKGVDLIVRRRKWYDKQNNRYFSDSYELKAEGTRYSKEFAAFLKGVYGDDSYDLPFA